MDLETVLPSEWVNYFILLNADESIYFFVREKPGMRTNEAMSI